MVDVKPQWKKRVSIFRFIFSDLILDDQTRDVKKDAFENYLFDADQMKIVEYYALHSRELCELIKQHLTASWTWERIPLVDRAAMLTAISEFRVSGLDKKIIIDQTLVTIKHYGDNDSPKYINAILDKILS